MFCQKKEGDRPKKLEDRRELVLGSERQILKDIIETLFELFESLEFFTYHIVQAVSCLELVQGLFHTSLYHLVVHILVDNREND